MQAEDSVFGLVQGLAQRFAQHSRSLPAQVDYTPVTTVIRFQCFGIDLAIPLEELEEVLEVPSYTRLPRVKDWVAGVANIRGKLLPIIDFAAFLGGALEAPTRQRRVLVLDLQGIYVGLMVDGVAGVKHFSTGQFRSDRADVPSALRRYVLGCFVDGESKVRMFRPAQLITDQAFLDVPV